MKNKRYFFLGDQHESKSEGGCEQKMNIKCDDFEEDFKHQRYYGSSCTSIGVLLHNWFTYNNDHRIPTDFYLEIDYTKEEDRYNNASPLYKTMRDTQAGRIQPPREYYNDKSWMELTRYLMRDCFVREKSDCPYHPYVHAHYADVRSLNLEFTTVQADPFLLFNLSEYIENFKPKNVHDLIDIKNQIIIILSLIINDYKELLQGQISEVGYDDFINKYLALSSGFSQELGRLYMQKIKNMSRIGVIRNGVRMHRAAAELQRLRQSEPELADLIVMFLEETADMYISEVQADFNETLQYLDEMDEHLESTMISAKQLAHSYTEIKTVFKNFTYALVPLSTLSMDGYLLARMFLQTNSKEVIVFAGSKHIEHYANFFMNYLGVQPKAVVESQFDNRCLNIVDLPDLLPANTYRTYMVKKEHGIKY